MASPTALIKTFLPLDESKLLFLVLLFFGNFLLYVCKSGSFDLCTIEGNPKYLSCAPICWIFICWASWFLNLWGVLQLKKNCRLVKVNLLATINFIFMHHLKYINPLGGGGFAEQQRIISKQQVTHRGTSAANFKPLNFPRLFRFVEQEWCCLAHNKKRYGNRGSPYQRPLFGLK